MKNEKIVKNENLLLDLVAAEIGARNDAQLARALGVAPPVISKTRNGHLAAGPALAIKIHEETGMRIAEIREYITRGPLLKVRVAK